ncbi:hypothetical protein ARALYDRAFT_905578 [Arabidopsis lyrata subsp. lyrata]|uniref:acid phosphatase n=1 Tax=Arabidopsis lyrata subsp. lyrata TaxID=81972 RepID=D7LMK4_ARALL|nr:hypothetical protein ARALYDRAFT_905578 [Arabidopsis lyrata subsp. lyrata]
MNDTPPSHYYYPKLTASPTIASYLLFCHHTYFLPSNFRSSDKKPRISPSLRWRRLRRRAAKLNLSLFFLSVSETFVGAQQLKVSFRDFVKKRDLDSKFKIDSAGTIDDHEGNMADPRMTSAAKRRGIEITSLSRPIKASDFRDFDLILAMDEQNKEDILKAYNVWKARGNFPPDADKKVKLMCSYCKKHNDKFVPDPYYGGAQGFEKVLDLLQDACESLLDSITAQS